jgi:hypothetical protein
MLVHRKICIPVGLESRVNCFRINSLVCFALGESDGMQDCICMFQQQNIGNRPCTVHLFVVGQYSSSARVPPGAGGAQVKFVDSRMRCKRATQ